MITGQNDLLVNRVTASGKPALLDFVETTYHSAAARGMTPFTIMNETQLLRRTALFAGIDDNTLAFLADGARSVFVRRDDFFFREVDEGAGVFVLIEGRAAELKTYQTKRHLLRYVNPGESFGEMVLLERAPRQSTVAAIADCVALEIPASRFRKLNQNDLRQFSVVQANLCRELQGRLIETEKQMFADPEETVILKGEQVLRPPA